jgi:hypothetical protein
MGTNHVINEAAIAAAIEIPTTLPMNCSEMHEQ